MRLSLQGSGPALRNWLTGSLRPNRPILSPNIGMPIPPAQALIMQVVPAETINDILFIPGWLNAELDVLDTHLNVGAVSGWPTRYSYIGGVMMVHWNNQSEG